MTEELKQKLWTMGVKVDDWGDGVDIEPNQIIDWVLLVKARLEAGEDHYFVRSGNTLVIGTQSLGIVVTSNYYELEWED